MLPNWEWHVSYRLISAFLVPWWIVPQDDLVTKSDVATANGTRTRAHRCSRLRASSIIKIMLDGINKLLIPFYVPRCSIGLHTFAGHVPCAVLRRYWTAPLAPGYPRHRPHKLLNMVTLTMQRHRGGFLLQDLLEVIYQLTAASRGTLACRCRSGLEEPLVAGRLKSMGACVVA